MELLKTENQYITMSKRVPANQPQARGYENSAQAMGMSANNVNIAAKAEANKSGNDGNLSNGRNKNLDSYECQTCKNRKYIDGSNDPSVSFKTPTHISPEKSDALVRGHEMEHVFNERAKAMKSENTEVVSQSVVLKNAICPECGRAYVAGGTTTTTIKTSRPVGGAQSEDNAIQPLQEANAEQEEDR